MSVTVKTYLLDQDEAVREIRKFELDRYGIHFDDLSRNICDVFSNLKNAAFNMFYRGEEGHLVAFSSYQELEVGVACMKDDTLHVYIKDAQHLNGRKEERPPTTQDGSSTLKQEDPQPPHIKEEKEELCISQSGEECFFGAREADLTKLPLTGVSVKTEDHEDKPQVDHLLAPLSDSDDITSHSTEDEDEDYIQEPLSSNIDCEGDMRTHTDNKHPECSKDRKKKKKSEKKTGSQQLIGRQEERPPKPQDGISTLDQDDLQPPQIKREEEEHNISQSGEECLLGPQEADLTKLPLTGVSVKTEDHKDKPQVDNLFAPLLDNDDITSQCTEDEDENNTQEPLSSDDGDMRTHTNEYPECSEEKAESPEGQGQDTTNSLLVSHGHTPVVVDFGLTG
ncbi:midasin-like isoform X3 [Entelurus aequoreus]|uniref:midasin-like isoform X3 n=1 Tax=Entelurus aequoreus TaxID=161455 RepID=UPI002B1D2289|nr:midasin-like isoform X3 [Entelurus aequoreus]